MYCLLCREVPQLDGIFSNGMRIGVASVVAIWGCESDGLRS